jgi:flagellar export protein FliJ
MAPKFSLQSVLDLRHEKVELLEIELGKLLVAQQEIQAQLEALQVQQAGLFEELNTAQSGEIDLFKMKSLRLEILQVGRQVESVSLDLARKTREIEARRARLIEARQSEETLEILKRNRHEVYMEELQRSEARAQDDIYIAQAYRNSSQGE